MFDRWADIQIKILQCGYRQVFRETPQSGAGVQWTPLRSRSTDRVGDENSGDGAEENLMITSCKKYFNQPTEDIYTGKLQFEL